MKQLVKKVILWWVLWSVTTCLKGSFSSSTTTTTTTTASATVLASATPSSGGGGSSSSGGGGGDSSSSSYLKTIFEDEDNSLGFYKDLNFEYRVGPAQEQSMEGYVWAFPYNSTLYGQWGAIYTTNATSTSGNEILGNVYNSNNTVSISGMAKQGIYYHSVATASNDWYGTTLVVWENSGYPLFAKIYAPTEEFKAIGDAFKVTNFTFALSPSVASVDDIYVVVCGYMSINIAVERRVGVQLISARNGEQIMSFDVGQASINALVRALPNNKQFIVGYMYTDQDTKIETVIYNVNGSVARPPKALLGRDLFDILPLSDDVFLLAYPIAQDRFYLVKLDYYGELLTTIDDIEYSASIMSISLHRVNTNILNGYFLSYTLQIQGIKTSYIRLYKINLDEDDTLIGSFNTDPLSNIIVMDSESPVRLYMSTFPYGKSWMDVSSYILQYYIADSWTAEFASDFLSIDFYLSISDKYLAYPINSTSTDCRKIFTNDSIDKIGTDAFCLWNNQFNTNRDVILSVYLQGNTKVYDGVLLEIQENVVQYTDGVHAIRKNNYITMDKIRTPKIHVSPQVYANVPSIIGICDKLILDAREAYHMGTPVSSENFIWWIVDSVPPGTNADLVNQTILGQYITLDMELGTNITIVLIAEASYHQSWKQEFEVMKTNTFVPYVRTDGIKYYRQDIVDTDIINIRALVEILNIPCLQANTTTTVNDISSLFSYHWRVFPDPLINITQINQTWVEQLIDYVARVDNPNLVLDVQKYLRAGFVYIFEVVVACKSKALACTETKARHTVTYDYSRVECQVVEGDAKFNVSLSDLKNGVFVKVLNASNFTIGNEFNRNDNSHFQYLWGCQRTDFDTQLISNCSETLFDEQQLTNPTPVINFTNEELTNHSYWYEFRVFVLDPQTEQSCESGVNLYLNVSTGPIEIQWLMVMTTVVKPTINTNDQIELLGSFILNNERVYDVKEGFSYQWKELNGFLNAAQIEICSQGNQIESLNLVLYCPQYLIPGATYRFALEITNDEHTYFGIAFVDVNINPTPVTVRGMLKAFVTATNTTCRQYNFQSWDDWLMTFFTISVLSDSKNYPLSYVSQIQLPMSDNEPLFIHEDLLYNNYLNFVILPPISNLTVISTTFDSTLSFVKNNITCSLHISNDQNCDVQNLEKIINISQLYFTNEKQRTQYIHQTLLGALAWALDSSRQSRIDSKCMEKTLIITIKLLTDYISKTKKDYCIELTNKELILVSEFSRLWNNLYINTCYDQCSIDIQSESMELWKAISEMLLDPCDYVSSLDIDTLKVNSFSIISQKNNIYQGDEVATPYIASIITKPLYQQSGMISIKTIFSMFALWKDMYSDTMNDELSTFESVSKLLIPIAYISQLIPLSISLPSSLLTIITEDIKMQSIRARLGNTQLQAGVATVLVPSEVIATGYQSANQLASVDILVIESLNIETIVLNEDDSDWKLIHEQITVQFIGLPSITNFSKDIEIHFNSALDQYTEEDQKNGILKCVSKRNGENTWKDDGRIIIDGSDITCLFTHATTFTIVAALSAQDAESVRSVLEKLEIQIIHVIFIVIFFTIFVYSMSLIFPLFFSGILRCENRNQWGLGVVNTCLIPIQCLLQIMLCVGLIAVVYITSDPAIKPLLVFSCVITMICEILALIMLSVVIHTWIVVAYPTSRDSIYLTYQQRIFQFYILVYIVIAAVFAIQLFFLISSSSTFLFTDIVFSVILLFAAVSFCYFGYRANSVISETFQMTQAHVTVGKQERKKTDTNELLFRIRASVIAIVLYLLIQLCLSIYLSTVELEKAFNFGSRFVGLLDTALLYCILLFMYQKNLRAMARKKEPSATPNTRATDQKKKKSMGSETEPVKNTSQIRSTGSVSDSAHTAPVQSIEMHPEGSSMPTALTVTKST